MILCVYISFPRLFTIETEYRWALEAAQLEWTRRLIADIQSGSLDGLELWRGFHAQRGN